jgi:uncharacterized protein (TIGR03083 family)
MAGSNPWPTIHAERAALAEDLSALPADAWSTPSLCGDWTVLDVLGHMTATATMTPPKFVAKMVRAGFRFHAMSAKEVSAHTAGGPQSALAAFRRHINDSTSPPGPVDSWLGETIVHSADIRRPLGIAHEYPTDALVRVADFYRRSNAIIGSKRRIEGVNLRATDADWSTGTGPEVTGPILSLLQVMTGRRQALGDVAGPGLAILEGRK